MVIYMAALKNALRCCKFCSYKKMDIENLGYYCSNRRSEHYMEKFKDDTIMQHCKGGNASLEKIRKEK